MRSNPLFVTLLVVLTNAAPAVAGQPGAPRPPREQSVPRTPPRDYVAGDSNRLKLRADSDGVAMVLEQADAPIALQLLSMHHDERGRSIQLRVDNRGTTTVTRYTIAAWVVMTDGTVKGSQRLEQKRVLTAGAGQSLTLTIRTVSVTAADAVVVGVLQTQGHAWTGDARAMERQAQAAVR